MALGDYIPNKLPKLCNINNKVSMERRMEVKMRRKRIEVDEKRAKYETERGKQSGKTEREGEKEGGREKNYRGKYFSITIQFKARL